MRQRLTRGALRAPLIAGLVAVALAAVVIAADLGPSSGRSAAAPASSHQATGGPWRQVFLDEFDNGPQRARWGHLYEGQPGGNADGYFHPSHVTWSGGIVRLEAYRDPALGNRWASGGMSSSVGLTQAYGKWEVRFRFDEGYGVGGAILLMPENMWPPEIDIYEDGGQTSDRLEMSATLHYSPSNETIQRTLRGTDFSAWHTVGVEWTPGKVVYLVDGVPWGSVTSPHVPDVPMWLAVQAPTGECGDEWAPCPNATTPAKVVMEVDYVKAWRYDPSAATGPGGGSGAAPGAGGSGGGSALATGLNTRPKLSRTAARTRGIPVVLRCSKACTASVVARIRATAARKLGLTATGRWLVVGRRKAKLAGRRPKAVRVRLPGLRDAAIGRMPALPVSLVVSSRTAQGARALHRSRVTIVP